MGLGNLFETLVVVHTAPADLLDPMLPAVQVYHFVQHRVYGFLNGIAQNLGGNIDFIGVIFGTLPDLCNGAVAKGSGLALDGDDRRGQLPAEKVCIQGIVDMLQLADGAAHFGCLLHGV